MQHQTDDFGQLDEALHCIEIKILHVGFKPRWPLDMKTLSIIYGFLIVRFLTQLLLMIGLLMINPGNKYTYFVLLGNKTVLNYNWIYTRSWFVTHLGAQLQELVFIFIFYYNAPHIKNTK